MKIDLGDDIFFEFDYKGKSYRLEEPSIMVVSAFEKNAVAVGGPEASVNLLVSMGAPKAVIEKMGAIKITKLIEGITGGLTEAKK